MTNNMAGIPLVIFVISFLAGHSALVWVREKGDDAKRAAQTAISLICIAGILIITAAIKQNDQQKQLDNCRVELQHKSSELGAGLQ